MLNSQSVYSFVIKKVLQGMSASEYTSALDAGVFSDFAITKDDNIRAVLKLQGVYIWLTQAGNLEVVVA